jgi:lipopolysaccharide/colanic/teichoic acid biosynthesis glycosyltransferase
LLLKSTKLGSRVLKRSFDILLSGVGLIVSLPLWGIIALAVKLHDGGPVFYRQERVGKDGWVFTGLKFRSMVPDSDRKWGVVPAAANDPRITKVGRILRATAMDELPQLWSIFRGDMSFVGPRPEWVELVKKFRAEIPCFDLRHKVRPGLTGLAQVYGHSEMPRRHKLRYDLLYARRQSFWLDIRLVLISFAVTFTGRWERREGKILRRAPRRYRKPASAGIARPLKAPLSKGALPSPPSLGAYPWSEHEG